MEAAARAPDVVAPPPGHPRFPLVDSLRALAFFMVFTIHAVATAGVFLAGGDEWYAPYVARLEVCLPIFFAISGFLLYRPFVAARLEGRPRPRLRAYARARVLRLVPAYWAVLTIVAVYPGIQGDWSEYWWGYYLFLQNYVPSWNEGTFLQTWSLTVEVAYYALLPLFSVLAARMARGGSRRATLRGELLLVGGLYATSVLFRLALTLIGYEASVRGVVSSPREAFSGLLPGTLYSAFPATCDWFALGLGLAVVSAYLHGKPAQPRLVRIVRDHPGAPWALAGALFLALVWFGPDFPEPFRPFSWFVTHATYGAITVLFLVPAIFGHTAGGAVRRLLASRVLTWLGVVSYGLFLWHVVALQEIRRRGAFEVPGVPRTVEIFIAGLALAIPCAAASYYLLERPLLRLKHRSQKKPRPAGLDPAAQARLSE